ncbi:Smr/MutS family protein [Terricaulis silvestris]|uniref:Smr domain protein n=1 Tax=Terricaulis silvestris TaxID=2686094 RepID=A0A6I6MNS4_9CAUL|nr:Smr/MutS family protein [Terricaulis silvestris]QGZ97010.1 Smr domain protein [Terricaulis silvestris]
MSKRGRDLTDEEKALWRRVASHVKTRKKLSPEPARDVARERPARASPTPRPQTPVVKCPVATPPANRAGEKRVRRGKLDIGASLDLHGHTQDSGRAALGRFLHGAAKRGERTVIVITGAGRGGEGVLKRALPEWLADSDLRALVSGFAQAHRSHGGTGAYYVFLKRPRD